jgi:alpha-1,6-mannosyltransferase
MDYLRDPQSLAAVLAGCDAFVHANDNEPFGLIVLEAMACGLPVIGVAAGGVAESVDETVGALATASEARAFAEAVDSVFARDVPALGLAARLRAEQRHGWDPVFRQLSAIYGRLTGCAAFTGPIGQPLPAQ